MRTSDCSYRDRLDLAALCAQLALEEKPQWLAMRDRVNPLVLQVLGYVMLGQQLGTPIVAHHRMQIPAQVGARSIVLCNPAYRDVERINLIVIRTIFECDGEVGGGRIEDLVHIGHGQLLVVFGALARNDDQIAEETEQLPK